MEWLVDLFWLWREARYVFYFVGAGFGLVIAGHFLPYPWDRYLIIPGAICLGIAVVANMVEWTDYRERLLGRGDDDD